MMALPILDPCCGSRMFYFDKRNPDVLFCDIRRGVDEVLSNGRHLVVEPDLIADVTELPFETASFHLVVFDPPHLIHAGNGWQAKTYGSLPSDWRTFMTKAFSECWRVLCPKGTLVFKWYEYKVPLKEVLKCAPCDPVFGNRTPSRSKTHWLVFFKDGAE